MEIREKKIYIRGWFGDWKEVTVEQARAFARKIMNINKPEVYARHVRGIGYEELAHTL
ncbi:MAG: hypothetical protein II547_03040 [Treponema sp.]|nr:hypothetical protein [Treponema sp.]